jgi:hypothetical protein
MQGDSLTMRKEPLTIQVEPDSELALALARADDEPVVLDSNGVRFRVIRASDDLWADYDPDAVLAGLRAVAGTLSAEEGERIKALIYRGRAEGTRPLSRP